MTPNHSPPPNFYMTKFITNSPRYVSQLLHRSKMSPVFTLYGGRGSSNTDRVRLTLAEGGITDYEQVIVNLQKGEQKVSGRHSPSAGLPYYIVNILLTPSHPVRRTHEAHPVGENPRCHLR